MHLSEYLPRLTDEYCAKRLGKQNIGLLFHCTEFGYLESIGDLGLRGGWLQEDARTIVTMSPICPVLEDGTDNPVCKQGMRKDTGRCVVIDGEATVEDGVRVFM